jgi:hypothetical protein
MSSIPEGASCVRLTGEAVCTDSKMPRGRQRALSCHAVRCSILSRGSAQRLSIRCML